MRKQLVVKKTRTINATPDEIWEILTNPKYYDNWMYVPGQVPGGKQIQLGSKIQWINDKNVVYLEGEVIEFVPNKKLVISLQDINWPKYAQKGSVTYEFHLTKVENGTRIKFYFDDLSVDPEAYAWFKAYSSSDEIGQIESIILFGRR